MSKLDVVSQSLSKVLLSRMGKLVPEWADGDAARVTEPSSADQTVMVGAFERQCYNASAHGAGAGAGVWDDWKNQLQEVIDRDEFLDWFEQFVYSRNDR